MPFRVHVHRVFSDLIRPCVVGFDRKPIVGLGGTTGWLAVGPAVRTSRLDA